MNKLVLQIKTQPISYPIIIGSEFSHNLSKILSNNSIKFKKCLLVIDTKVPQKKLNKILKSFKKQKIFTIYLNANELNKSQKSVDKILNILLKNNFLRNDCLISIGGGIVGDLSGYTASIFKRGMKFVNVPTTLLSQVDSSIGGKTGVNSLYGKNLVGTFFQPNLVLCDTAFLKSLPKRQMISGYAEILKHSLIFDKKFFLYLDKNFSKILNLESPYIENSIKYSCLAKRKIIQVDEKEKNIRKVLNLGHTFGHAYETALNYSRTLNHGEAVLLGIYNSTNFSYKNNLLNKSDYILIKKHFIKFNLPSKINKYFTLQDLKKIITLMKNDKKNNSNNINLILLKKIGKPLIDLHFNKAKINSFIKQELIN